ncbi:ParB/RepB/Spo0J family partition protein [Azohydromonas caseinilytica]|uniref:ParB/RepB/Spo0J family partition protein n=1 Tax=Azohydromonas caseinilytica TaxID=2728836 RepID=UPI00197C022E|nr:ParB/RepB/Spo0J family partition protein [Azohydromonas caseinilytica]
MTNPAKRAAAITFDNLEPATAAPAAPAAPAAAPARPAAPTGIGKISGFFQDGHRTKAEIDRLTQQVSQLEKERGAQPIDPALITASRWANRHADSYITAEFEALRAEIQDAGGNVQPIKVRPRPDAKDGEPQYEIVFGHRRHRACLELGLPVLAVVQPLSDTELFTHMERENRNRQSLSAYEQGAMYRRALDEGLFPSMRKLAEGIGRAISDVVKATQIAQLPSAVLEAFPSPNDIQFRWATDLKEAVAQHEQAVLAAAKQAAADRLPAPEVFRKLTACLRRESPARAAPLPERKFNLGAGRRATIVVDDTGHTVLKIAPGVLPPEKWKALESALKALLD